MLAAIILIWMASSSAHATPFTFPCDPLHQCIGTSWDEESSVGNFGYPTTMPASQTYGQIIAVPALGDTVLTSFSFLMNLPGVGQDNTNPAMNTKFQAYVFKWKVDRAIDDALFTSPLVSIRTNGYQVITFDTGALSLNDPGTYVLFASILGEKNGQSGDSLGGAGNGRWAADGQGYSGGEFVSLSSGEWTAGPWTTMGSTNPLNPGGDLAFNASFVSETKPVPEPGSLPLIGGAAIAAVAAAMRRRRK